MTACQPDTARKFTHFMIGMALTIATLLPVGLCCAAQVPGISVQLATTTYAAAAPAADNPDATVVTVTAVGTLYFGVNLTNLEDMAIGMRSRQFNSDKKLYIKADARTPYSNVRKVLEIAGTSGVEAATLLTSQPELPHAGTPVSPKGIEVLLHQPANSATNTPPVVWIRNTGRPQPTLWLNNQPIKRPVLPVALKQVLQEQKQKVVVVSDQGLLTFEQVVDLVDICSSLDAQAVLAAAK